MQTSTVQLIKRAPYVRQGLIEYDGAPEDLGEWLEAGGNVAAVVESGLLGWGDYRQVVRLPDVDGSYLYYLAPDIDAKGR